jgi:hypothetical protein
MAVEKLRTHTDWKPKVATIKVTFNQSKPVKNLPLLTLSPQNQYRPVVSFTLLDDCHH